MKKVEGQFQVKADTKIALVVGRFNSFIVEQLVEGAIDALVRMGGVNKENITLYYAPGAYELPLLAKKVAQTDAAGVVALGAVMRGGTPHFEYVAGECTKGLAQVSLDSEKPIAFGVLTVDSIEQAIERAGTKAGNKGAEAALSTLEMLSLFEQF